MPTMRNEEGREVQMERRGALRKRTVEVEIGRMTARETVRFRRYRTMGTLCLSVAMVLALAFAGLVVGGGWVRATWFVGGLSVAIAGLSFLYFARAGRIEEDVTDRMDAADRMDARRNTNLVAPVQEPGAGRHHIDTDAPTRLIVGFPRIPIRPAIKGEER